MCITSTAHIIQEKSFVDGLKQNVQVAHIIKAYYQAT